MTHVLLVSVVPVGPRMGGWGPRIRQLTESIGGRWDVRLAAPGPSAGDSALPKPLDYTRADPWPLIRAARQAAAVVTAPQTPEVGLLGKRRRTPWLMDMYVPAMFEAAEQTAHMNRVQRSSIRFGVRQSYADALDIGDFIFCAGERQRDLWLGALVRSGRIPGRFYEQDQTLRTLIDVVPPAVPGEPFPAVAGTIRRTFPEISPADKIVLWNGGIYDWLDPLTPIRAIDRLRRTRPEVKLVFMSVVGPQNAGKMASVAKAVDLADRLGLTGKWVFFNESWVHPDDRAGFLRDAACVVIADHDRLETRFSFRNRVLDCIWARIPVVTTGGDVLTERMARAGLCKPVAFEDPAQMARAIESTIFRKQSTVDMSFESLAEELSISVTTRPLLSALERLVSTKSSRPRPSATVRGLSYTGLRLGQAAARKCASRFDANPARKEPVRTA